MSENYEIFRKLLAIDELYDLFSQIGESLLTNIDIANFNKDKISTANSIELLHGTDLIQYNTRLNVYYKKVSISSKELFVKELFRMMVNNYSDVFSFINEIEISYDESEAKYYTKRNFIALNLMGLLMLLNGMDIVRFKDNYVYFIEKNILSGIVTKTTDIKRKTDLTILKEQLERQEMLGNEAEIAALEFEKEVLYQKSILKEPERVSLYDVAAGYDIVSYMSVESVVPDKFIEVKSCSDDKMQFYISRNELEVAKRKKESYYLYLFIRSTNEFKVISNPYTVFFENGNSDWAIESQVYKIHSIVR